MGFGSFDRAGYAEEKKSAGLIPEEEFRAKIESIEYTKDGEEMKDKNRNKMVKLVVKVEGFPKKSLWVFLSDNEWYNKNVGDIIESCGMADEIGEGFNLNMLVGRIGRVKIKHGEHKGKPTDNVHYWIAPEDGEDAKQPQSQQEPRNDYIPQEPDPEDDLPF